MKDSKSCRKGEVRAIDGKCYPGIKTKHWTLVESVGDLQIYHGVPKTENWRGTLTGGEEDWQPSSIQVSKDNMKVMQESNVVIFFDMIDLIKKNWKNPDLP